MPVTPAEFRKQMDWLAQPGDPESSHGMMDDLMCKVLTEHGYGEGVEIFNAADKWYA